MNKKNIIDLGINFILKRYFSFPTLKFILNTKNQFIKNLYIDFWIKISKKNKNFFEFFFSNTYSVDKDIYIKQFENLDESLFFKLKKNGIIAIENALNHLEHKKIIEIFDKISIQDNKNLRKNQNLIKYFEKFDIDNFENLKKYSDLFSNKIYGSSLKTLAEFHVHRALKLPETIINGDNNLHIDRFLPNMKIYYSPFEINERGAPFCYALESHKINNKYIQFIKTTKNFSDTDPQSSIFLKEKKEITCKPNTLIVALTNGFHGRKPFLDIKDRKVVFLQFHNSFNKLSLLFK